jgi:pyridoxamine 5'-phosphate oxidase
MAMTTVPPELRREYMLDSLDESAMAGDPFAQFEKWFTQAQKASVPEPNAMSLATADASGRPSARIVLLKGFDSRGFMFFTNYASRKGSELAANPRAALCFHWQLLERQVRIEGTIEKTTRQESDEYFHSRPRDAQIGAWISEQSAIIDSREALERAGSELRKRFGDGSIPLPEFWGGYRVIPDSVEFWQGRLSRLHDRLQYLRNAAGWKLQRLSP